MRSIPRAPKAADSVELLGGGIAGSSVADLVRLLTHADRRVRQQAQFELVRRNELDELMTIVPNCQAMMLRDCMVCGAAGRQAWRR